MWRRPSAFRSLQKLGELGKGPQRAKDVRAVTQDSFDLARNQFVEFTDLSITPMIRLF